MSTSTELPQEIIDAIIDEVAGHGPPDIYWGEFASNLYACCLTAQRFVPRVRKHIFQKIILTPESAWVGGYPTHFTPTARRFREHVTPSSARLVETVILSGPGRNLYHGDETDLEDWVAKDRALVRVISSLSALNAVEIRGVDLTSAWTHSLQAMFAQCSIKTVTFSGVWAVYRQSLHSVFGAFPAVQEICVRNPPRNVHGYYWSNSLFNKGNILLDVLDTDVFGLARDSGRICLPQINHLEFRPESLVPDHDSKYGPASVVSRLLASMQSLESLSLDIDMVTEDEFNHKWLPTSLPLQNLLTLTITSRVPAMRLPPLEESSILAPRHWSLYARSLAIVDEKYRLEFLQVQIIISTDNDVISYTAAANWEDLPASLLAMERLRHVSLVILARERNDEVMDKARQVHELLSRMLSTGGNAFYDLAGRVEVLLEIDDISQRVESTSRDG
ncbi:hypothetical protein BDZ89DRAFT_1063374 [Hymenopellis radicata]|nr:hypothetical protein BDZ89DRAFT_1063374 [Hymenopellis radicata]